MRTRERGFTLIEMVVALVLLGTMMVLLYDGLTFALRSWDAGDANGRRTADRRIGENFLRREVAEVFPMRWKDPGQLRYAFDGGRQVVRFVSSRAAAAGQGGLSLVSVGVEEDPVDHARHDLVMRRVLADPDAADFSALDGVKPSVLVEDVESVDFSYFGAENDFADPQWVDEWKWPARMPVMVRLAIKGAGGTPMPDMIIRVMVGEEAGCLESGLQRGCRPRRT
jgi:general secretion pathway protein J